MIFKRDYVIFDVETTGLLNESKAEVIEFGCQILDKDTLKTKGKFSSLIKPKNFDLNKPIPQWAKKAMEINNIPIEDLKKADDPEIVCRKIIGILKELNKPIVAGHNIISFDIPMMERLFKSCNLNFYDYISYLCVDTYPLCHLSFSDNATMPNVKLGTVCKAVGIKLEDAHRVEADVKANADLLIKFIIAMQKIGNENKLSKADAKSLDKKKQKSDFKCPSCKDGYLYERTNRAKGTKFYGCSSYPRCKHTCQPWEVAQYKVEK